MTCVSAHVIHKLKKKLRSQDYEMTSAGPSRHNSHRSHDYTEGAPAIDIDSVIAHERHARRNSQGSALYDIDGTGAVFDGPGHGVYPSSVSRMSQQDLGRTSEGWARNKRRSRDSISSSTRGWAIRRLSMGSQISRQSLQNERQTSPEPDVTEFEDLHGYSGVNRAMALEIDDEAEERWGYSSGEEDEHSEPDTTNDDVSVTRSMECDSSPPSPGASLPFLATDPLFGGDSRVDMDFPEEDLGPSLPGSPSRQMIYIADDDSTVRFIGYESIPWRQHVWRAGCILTLGLLGLLGHWFPRLWLRCATQEKAFIDLKEGFVVVEVRLSRAWSLLPFK